MTDVIDLSRERDKRSGPDAEHIRRDEFGRPMYRFAVSYECAGSQWACDLWAYSIEDAATRVEAMRATLVLDGQVWESGPI